MAEFDHIRAEVESIDEAGMSIIDTKAYDEDLYVLKARLDLWPEGREQSDTTAREGQYLISVLYAALNQPEGAAVRAKAEAEVIEYMGEAD